MSSAHEEMCVPADGARSPRSAAGTVASVSRSWRRRS